MNISGTVLHDTNHAAKWALAPRIRIESWPAFHVSKCWLLQLERPPSSILKNVQGLLGPTWVRALKLLAVSSSLISLQWPEDRKSYLLAPTVCWFV